MQKSSAARSGKRTAFVPRLAYGCFSIGMGVIPLCAGCSSDNEVQSVGIGFHIPDGGFGDTAPSVDIVPDTGATEDAPSVGIVVGFADSGAGEEASTIGIRPADIPDGGPDTEAPDGSEDDAPRATTDASGD